MQVVCLRVFRYARANSNYHSFRLLVCSLWGQGIHPGYSKYTQESGFVKCPEKGDYLTLAAGVYF